jgi:hypothetical protein
MSEMVERVALRKMAKAGYLLVPRQISWRKAQKVVSRGWATLHPFHERWMGRLELTAAGRAMIDLMLENKR